MTEPPVLIHYRIDTRPALLFLRCATCGAHREVSCAVRSARLVAEASGWKLGTAGSLDADQCPACAEKARGRAA